MPYLLSINVWQLFCFFKNVLLAKYNHVSFSLFLNLILVDSVVFKQTDKNKNIWEKKKWSALGNRREKFIAHFFESIICTYWFLSLWGNIRSSERHWVPMFKTYSSRSNFDAFSWTVRVASLALWVWKYWNNFNYKGDGGPLNIINSFKRNYFEFLWLLNTKKYLTFEMFSIPAIYLTQKYIAACSET